MKKFTAAEIAKFLGAELVGNGNEEITGVASLNNATSDDLSLHNFHNS